MVVAIWNMMFRPPRSCGGAISDRYSGTACARSERHSCCGKRLTATGMTTQGAGAAAMQ